MKNIIHKEFTSPTLALFTILFAGVGCSNFTLNYVEDTNPMMAAWGEGNYAGANGKSTELIEKKDFNNEKNTIVVNLEHAMTLRAIGKYEESNAALDQAITKMNEMEAANKAGKGAAEVGSALSNLNAIPYRGFSYDRIMAHTCKALNFLAEGKLPDARRELNKAYEAQRDAVAENEKRIVAEEDKVKEQEAKQRKKLKGADLTVMQTKVDSALAEALKNLPDINPAYGPYVNPFTEYLQGIFLTKTGQDVENGQKALTRVLKMSGNNKYVDADITGSSDNQALTYVIVENGIGPHRQEKLFEITVTVRVQYVDENGQPTGRYEDVDLDFIISWPELVASGNSAKTPLKITAGGQTMEALEVANMGSVVAVEFKNRWPGMRNRIIVSSLVKAAGSIGATKMLGGLGGALGNLYQEASKHTDTRTWRTLPESFQVCRFATPADRKMTISMGGKNKTLDIAAGTVNVVYIKRTGEGSNPILHQFKLK